MLRFLFILLFIGLAAFGGWQFGRQQHSHPATVDTTRKVLFYQSPMHPWIKSEQPGNCTICGMKLVPVYEGEAAADSPASADLTKLSAQSASVVGIETTAVTRQPLSRVIRVAGQIADDDSRHRRLSAYVDGRVDKLFVNYVGAEVKTGEPLASIFSRELLVARSEHTVAIERPPSRERETTIAASRQKLRRLGLTDEQIERLPKQTGETFDIVAPISGTVVERKVYEGQYVKEGDVLFEIADFSKMWFVFDAYERDLAWIRIGQTVEITTPSVPGKVFTAPIAFIDPNLMPQTRTANVRVILENPVTGDHDKHRRELLHNVYADGRIHVATEPLLTVPRSAVLSPGGDALVYVAKGEREYQVRHVTLGRAGDEVWEVLDGLAEGERVVTTGNLLVDAQAQLERPTSAPRPEAMAALSDAQRAAADVLFSAAAASGGALASDDLAGYNARVAALREAAGALAAELGEEGARLKTVGEVGPAADLTAARKQFYPLSMSVSKLALSLRAQVAEPVKVYECPMAKSAVPSAETNQGRWIQREGPLRNPFFGAEMLECGAEVRP